MIYAYTLLTLVVFSVALQISKRLKSIIFNSFILTVAMLISIIVMFDVPYTDYMAGNTPLNHLLGVSVVALALPLYEQFRQIKEYWKTILFITALSSLFSMLVGALLALLLGAEPEIVATILPKSVTTPIAMEIAQNIGGIPAVAAAAVLIAGLQGSMFGYVILKVMKIKYAESIGLSIGAVSHVLGTVSCMEVDPKAGNYSSIALVLCGILSSIFAPFVFKFIYFWVV
ncbi:CidB/LrgB family autolysis modulator [Avibacterium sp. 21-595]|uniref:CidB/LrgB family autolysis modulator n=1 Tax=Avibacterium sp. 21-595 TaxID=2911527 RepID=UPI00202613D0|nr:CidB/LrgB family autolysis modulator [Avibacterium sp. 21-595]URL07514.1 CidB/LrgB family autolysis modulator [Avibacterium sp. 21-595]